MIPVLNGQDFADIATFVAALNKARRQNKGQWISYVGNVAGRSVSIKSFDTGFLQILRVDGIDHGGYYDQKVGDWKNTITKALQYQHPAVTVDPRFGGPQ